MKKRMHKLALVSLALAMVAFFCAASRAGAMPLFGILLGLVALILGAASVAAIRRKKPLYRGTGIAVFGAFLGALDIFFGFAVLASMVMQNINRNQWRSQQSTEIRRAMGPSRMPETPVTNFTSNLPIMVLHTRGQFYSKESSAVVRAEIFEPGAGRASTGNTPNYEGLMSIHLRGNTTLHLPKQCFTVHTLDSETNQTKVALLGMPKEEDWVLYAPFEDKTMIRDVLAYHLSNKMGHYAPRTRYVELFIDSSAGGLSMRNYAGVYVLMEKIKRSESRVDIAKLTPQDKTEPNISGGYLIKRDHSDRSEKRFQTSQGGPYFFVYPDSRRVTSEQRNWLTRYFNTFEAALYGDEFKDPARGYAAYLDVDAFIDMHWLIELSKNVDGFRYSAFITKDRNGKIQVGPAWDWNRAFGNANYYGGAQTQGWYSKVLRPNEICWSRRLQEDPAFVRRCNARWYELRRTVLDLKNIKASIDDFAAQLAEAQERNFQRWPILGQHITCNAYVGDSYEDEIRYLKRWIEGRINWIDQQVGTAANL